MRIIAKLRIETMAEKPIVEVEIEMEMELWNWEKIVVFILKNEIKWSGIVRSSKRFNYWFWLKFEFEI